MKRTLNTAAIGLALLACTNPAVEETVGPQLAAPPLGAWNDVRNVVTRLMESEGVPGIALAILDDGRVRHVEAFGMRDLDAQLPLETDTVMYGASLTKFVFAVFVMQLVDDGLLDLDQPILELLPKPLPDYEDYADLAADARWQDLTLRRLLSHSSGFPNYRFFPPEGGFDEHAKLQFYFDPGERYGYSGEGYYIAQLVVEETLGLEMGDEAPRRIFEPLAMHRTGLTWRDDFAPNLATGYALDGEAKGHNRRSNVRAAGSMDTTIDDLASFVAAFLSDELTTSESRTELTRPQIGITSKYQFPTLDASPEPRNESVELSAGLGVVTWTGPQGRGFFKGGHDDKTDNILVCLETSRRCVVLLSNTPKGDRVFPQIVEAVLGETELPWRWEYSSLEVLP